jgi:molybdopterin/thiamine biosynthesis adenylyltransferase
LDYFARQELVLDGEMGSRIRQTRVLVVGAGAGGNEVLKNLALMGFGQPLAHNALLEGAHRAV